MKLVRHLTSLPAQHTGSVIAIGNFDGIHLGHQSIIRQMLDTSRETGFPCVLFTFEPYPREFFSPEKAPARIMRLREKIICLREFAIDYLVCQRFDLALSKLPAEDFIEQYLVDKLRVRRLIVGEDFRFGHNRTGDLELLLRAGRNSGFEVDCTGNVVIDGRRVSSSWLRECLEQGDLSRVMQLTGRPYTISGRVVHGDKRGKSLGFPTININLHRLRSPVSGIFASRVHGLVENGLPAVSSIGSRPVFNGTFINLETHILDFSGDVYNRYVSVELCKKIRDEQDFTSVDDLKARMKTDIEETRNYFLKQNNN